MLVVIGIGILIVSFVIALFSLIREERHRERLVQKHEEIKSAGKDVEVEPRTQETERISENSGFAGELVKSKADKTDEFTKDGQFPWERISKHDKVPAPDVSASSGAEIKQETEDIPLSAARFPHLGGEDKSLSGSFKIGEIAKKDD